MKNKNYCIDCGKEIDYRSKRCRKCANILITDKQRIITYCKICKKRINNTFKMCRKCYLKSLKYKRPYNYKGGRPRCIDCGKLIWYGFKRCKHCAGIYKWKDEEYRKRQRRLQSKGMNLSPNKPEKVLIKLLNTILPNQYRFVGDGNTMLCGFVPDFINCNGLKKIIELYGNYWHNKKEVKYRDKRRIIAYKKLGYKTLIIWEKELKNINKVKEKILEFNFD